MAKRKKILLLSDDMRMASGIATVSRWLIKGTIHKYDWVQVAAAIKHADSGKVIDLTQSVEEEWGIPGATLKLYPNDGYGDQNLIRNLLQRENPDAILHFTDPRQWLWLYHMEHELREKVPLLFYHIWDDLPYPMYNRNYYESCDWIGCISKQTYNIVKNVWGSERKDSWKQFEDWQVSYVPHGINSEEYFPIKDKEDLDKLEEFKKERFGDKLDGKEFIVLWNNRNIRRKLPGDVILSYKSFCDTLSKEDAEKCALVMHTDPIDQNGTDLPAVAREICPDYDIYFSSGKIPVEKINYLYNIADITINIASNEGFGLTTCESLHTETPIILNVTGGLQDQCGFRDEDGDLVWVDDHFNAEWGSNHDGRYTDHGEWVKPVWPKTRSLVGSPPTPYIFDDRCDWKDVQEQLRAWWDMTPSERKEAGRRGREYCLSNYPDGGGLNMENMCQALIDGIEATLENWTPRERMELFTV